MIASYVWLARLDTFYHVYVLLEFKLFCAEPLSASPSLREGVLLN
jgi:hypothetical protein